MSETSKPTSVPWVCRVFGHKFEDWSGRVVDFCLRCGIRHQ